MNGLIIKDLDYDYQNNKNICLVVIKQNRDAFKYIRYGLEKDEDAHFVIKTNKII